MSDCCFQLVNREDKPYYEITAGEHLEYVAPVDAAKLIFHKMKGNYSLTHTHAQKHTHSQMQTLFNQLIFPNFTETAQSALGSDVTEAVVTVPFEFAHAQKHALR